MSFTVRNTWWKSLTRKRVSLSTQGNGEVQQDQEEANDQLNVDTEEEMKKNGSKGFFINNSFKHCNNLLRRKGLQMEKERTDFLVI